MLSNSEIILRLMIAAALGGLIGFERERTSWSAGLRTHMIVSAGACLVMIVSSFGFSDILGHPGVMLDPSRMAAQVVSGIGFLGAGAILLRGEVIRGLTTAASVWTVAAIGLAIGGGLYIAGIFCTLLILVILSGIKPFEDRYRQKNQSATIALMTRRGEMSIDLLRNTLGDRSHFVQQFVVQQKDGSEYDSVTIALSRMSRRSTDAIIAQLRALPAVVEIREDQVHGRQ